MVSSRKFHSFDVFFFCLSFSFIIQILNLSVARMSFPLKIRASPMNCSFTLTTAHVHCTASSKESAHLFVRFVCSIFRNFWILSDLIFDRKYLWGYDSRGERAARNFRIVRVFIRSDRISSGRISTWSGLFGSDFLKRGFDRIGLGRISKKRRPAHL